MEREKLYIKTASGIYPILRLLPCINYYIMYGDLPFFAYNVQRSTCMRNFTAFLIVWSSYWGEPERAPPGQFNGLRCLFIYIPQHRTSSTRDHLFTCTVYSRSQIKTFAPRPTLDGDSSRGWYGLPGRSVQRSQASGSDKLAGSFKHM